MKRIGWLVALSLGWMLMGSVATGARAASVETFDDLPALPAVTSYAFFPSANGNSSDRDGITFDADIVVVGDQYVEQFEPQGTNTFAHPHSGHYAVFNASGADGVSLVTTRILLGIWFARPDFGNGPGGTTSVTVSALDTIANVLDSHTLDLTATGTTMTFLDTSSFAAFSNITAYRIDRVQTGVGPYGGTHWVADDLTFAPEPATDATELAAAAALLVQGRRRARRGRRG